MFVFCGVSVLIPPLILCLVTLLQNDSKARAIVLGRGWKSKVVDGLSPHPLAQRRAFFPHPFAFLTLTAIKPPALHGSLRTQWLVEHCCSGWFKDTAGSHQTPSQALIPLGRVSRVSHFCAMSKE